MGRCRRPNFVIFVVCSALIVVVWVVLVRDIRSCLGPADIASFVFLALFRHTILARSQSIRGAYHQPNFMSGGLLPDY